MMRDTPPPQKSARKDSSKKKKRKDKLNESGNAPQTAQLPTKSPGQSYLEPIPRTLKDFTPETMQLKKKLEGAGANSQGEISLALQKKEELEDQIKKCFERHWKEYHERQWNKHHDRQIKQYLDSRMGDCLAQMNAWQGEMKQWTEEIDGLIDNKIKKCFREQAREYFICRIGKYHEEIAVHCRRILECLVRCMKEESEHELEKVTDRDSDNASDTEFEEVSEAGASESD